MIAKVFSLIALSAIGYQMAGDGTTITTIELGTTCPMNDAKMKNVDGTMQSLAENVKDKGLLVIFSCNTCPFVVGDGGKSEGWDGRYNGLYELATKNNIGMVLVNSNYAKRDHGDSFDDMVKRAGEKGFKMPYLYDEKSAIANAFGAKTTPHVFLFDGKMRLVYRGAIDDNVNSAAEVKIKYLENAMNAISLGKNVEVNDTRPVGCSIKRG